MPQVAAAMTRAALTIAAIFAGTVVAVGQDVRAASEKEMADLLLGCWREELPIELKDWQHDVCFGTRGAVATPMTTCGTYHGCSHAVGRGTYLLVDGKLVLQGSETDQGWIFYRAKLSCDVLIDPGRAIKLMNCADGWEVIGQSRSFGFLSSGWAANE